MNLKFVFLSISRQMSSGSASKESTYFISFEQFRIDIDENVRHTFSSKYRNIDFTSRILFKKKNLHIYSYLLKGLNKISK